MEFDDFITESDPTDLYFSSKVKGVQDVAIRYLKQLITTKLKTE